MPFFGIEIHDSEAAHLAFTHGIAAGVSVAINLVRFNALSGLGTQACACIASLQQDSAHFGDYTGLLTQPRVMQFGLRYEF